MVEDPTQLTDTEWFENTGMGLKLFGSTVRVKTRTNSKAPAYYNNGGLYYYYNTGKVFNIQTGTVILTIPVESILEIESKYGRLKINNNIKSLLLDNTDGEIEFANIDKLQLRSNRGSFSGGTIAEGDIELAHGRLFLKQLTKGAITSNYSTIEIESAKDVKLSSSNDEVDIDDASALYGVKNYGNLRINQLTSKLDIQGINSDIKLRHINPSAQLVKIVNRNADLRLPANELSNFSVDLRGSYNKIYSSVVEDLTVDTLTTEEIESVKSITSAVPSAGNTVSVTGTTLNKYDSFKNISNNTVTIFGQATAGKKQNLYWKYSAKVGTGNPLKYQIICTSCVIDFK
jgi:hypothetical protein